MELSYIRDLNSNSALRFDYLTDGAEFTDTVSVSWGEQAIIGRSEPFRYYEGTSKRSIGISLFFCSSVCVEDTFYGIENNSNIKTSSNPAYATKNKSIAQNIKHQLSDRKVGGVVWVNEQVPMEWRVVHQVNFLRSFLYPTYVPNQDGTGVSRVDKPPLAYLSLASFLKFKGIVTEVGVSWKRPFISNDLQLPIVAEVTLNFDVISDTPYDSNMIRNSLNFLNNTSLQAATPNQTSSNLLSAQNTQKLPSLPEKYVSLYNLNYTNMKAYKAKSHASNYHTLYSNYIDSYTNLESYLNLNKVTNEQRDFLEKRLKSESFQQVGTLQDAFHSGGVNDVKSYPVGVQPLKLPNSNALNLALRKPSPARSPRLGSTDNGSGH